MNGSRKIIAVITGILLVATIILVTVGLLKTTNQLTPKKILRDYNETTSNIQNYSVRDNSIFFFTGAFFAKYNLATNKVERLSDYLFLDNEISSFDWSEGSVIFRSQPYSKGEGRDDVWASLFAHNSDTFGSHWWRYSFSTNQYQLLAMDGVNDCTQLYQLDQSSLVCQQPENGSQNSTNLMLYNLTDHTKQTLVKSKDKLTNVKFSGDDIYFVSTNLGGKQSLHTFNTQTHKERVVYRANGRITSYIASNKIMLSEKSIPTNKEGDEHELGAKLNTQKISLLSSRGKVLDQKSFEALVPTTYKNGDQIQLSPGDGSIITAVNGKLGYLQDATIEGVNGTELIIDYEKIVYLINQDGRLYSTKKVSPSDPYQPKDLFDNDSNNPSSGAFLIESADPGDSEALVFLYDNTTPFKQQTLAIDSYLYKEGFLPSEFRFSWAKTSAADGVPLTPNSIVIK